MDFAFVPEFLAATSLLGPAEVCKTELKPFLTILGTRMRAKDSKCTAFDGPPKIVALGFQVSNGQIACDDNGKPMVADLFDDPAFELARKEAVKIGSMLRRMGEFEPARLGPEEMEYTTLQQVLDKLKERFVPA